VRRKTGSNTRADSNTEGGRPSLWLGCHSYKPAVERSRHSLSQ